MGCLSGRFHRWLGVTGVALMLAGCASTGAAGPTATQPSMTADVMPLPSPTDRLGWIPTAHALQTFVALTPRIPVPTSTERPTRMPTPTGTPVPTATSYPAPAVPLAPAGPWLIFEASSYLWAINQDGTGLTRLTDDCVLDFAVRPNSAIQGGPTIAYSTSLDGKCERWYQENPPGLIKILSGPERNVKIIVHNLSQGAEELTWSPSGNKLAFIGAMGDTDSNVFVYDAGTEEATRIAVTDYNDCTLIWSPDERYVIHQTGCGCSMGFCTSIGMWASRADAGGVTQLIGDTEHGWVLGWLNPIEIVTVLNQWVSEEIRIVNTETGSYTTLFSESFLDIAYSPEHNMFLMTKETSTAPNRLLVFYQNGEKREVTGYTIKEVRWLSAYDTFLGQTPDGRLFLISPDGTVAEIPTHQWDTYDAKSINSHSVIVSPDYQWWAQYHSRYLTSSSASELWVGPAKAEPSVRLSTSLGTGPNDGSVNYSNVIWSPDSQHLLWLSAGRLFIAHTPNFEAAQVAELPKGSYLWNAVWVR